VSRVRAYRREWLRADLAAGVTAGLVVIRQAMAYATIADLPVEVGLATCVAPMVAYADSAAVADIGPHHQVPRGAEEGVEHQGRRGGVQADHGRDPGDGGVRQRRL
jgi:hypothetical protein